MLGSTVSSPPYRQGIWYGNLCDESIASHLRRYGQPKLQLLHVQVQLVLRVVIHTVARAFLGGCWARSSNVLKLLYIGCVSGCEHVLINQRLHRFELMTGNLLVLPWG